MGTGLGHYIPLVAYLGFWVAIFISLFKKPVYGLYYMIPFLPYRTMRDHFMEWPLGASVVTILVFAVIIGAFFHGKRLPKSRLIWIWFAFGFYLYLSMWMGTALTAAPAPLWLHDANFVTWKDYMLTPLVFVAAAMTLDDRKTIRTAIMIAAFSLFMIDRSSLMESLSHTWTSFDEDKRSGGPLGYGSNQTAAFLAQFAVFFWGFMQFVKRKKLRLFAYALVALTLLSTMYCFSRAGYLGVIVSVLMLGIVKDRKLLIIGAVFLFTWQAVVPTAVTQRVNMTHQDGQLDESAQERVELWTNAENTFMSYPVFGTGFATFQYGEHVGELKDTHNWYVKVLVETGLVGLLFALALLQSMFSVALRLFRKAEDPLYRGLGLGLFVCLCCLVITNFFGDRWTYIEINGLLWILIGAAVQANALSHKSAEKDLEPGLPALTREYAYVG